MKRIKKYLMTILFLFIPIVVLATNEYEIEDNDILIEITEDKIYYTENTNIIFLKNNVQFERKLNNNINDFELNTNYLREENTIKMNNRNKNSYIYTFKYNLDKSNKNNYSLKITNGYQLPITNTSFTIDTRDSIFKDNITIYYNDKDITQNANLKIEDHQIVGELDYELKPGEEFIIKIDYTKVNISPTILFSWLFPIACCIISYVMWYFYGKDLKTKITKTSLLPRKINPIDVALIYNEEITEEDIFALLIDLANKGYIKIEENDKHEFTLTRIKDYKGKDYRENLFIKYLFRKEKTLSLSDYINAVAERSNNFKFELINEIPNEELTLRFKKASNKILDLTNTDSEKNKYFEDSAESLKKVLILMVTLILVTMTSIPFIEINKLFLLPISVLFSILTLKILLDVVKQINLRKIRPIDILSITIIVIIIGFIIMLPSFASSKLYGISYLISCTSVTIILFLYKYMPKRTIYGNRLLGQIEGFKSFIETSTDTELDRVLELNPNYLYDIYSYARVLKLNDLVIKRMKNRTNSSPEWLEIKEFSNIKFRNTIERLLKKIKEEGEEK